MTSVKEKQYPARSFAERLDSMFRVDARRMFGTPLFWICLGIAFAIPVLVLVIMMIPMMTPLDSGVMNVGLCLAGGVIFAAGIGTVSNRVLKNISLIG
jgi:hypothetical protein